MFLSFIAYTPLFFWARGNLTVSPTHWWKFEVHTDKNVVQDLDPDGRKRRAIGMIAFVIITLAVIQVGFNIYTSQLPTCICHHHSPNQCGPLGVRLWQKNFPQPNRCDICSRVPLQSIWRIQCCALPRHTLEPIAAQYVKQKK